MNFVSIRHKVISPVVIISTLAFASVGAALAYGLLLSYHSRAVVSFQTSLSEFRILQEQLNNVPVFDRYASADVVGGGGAALRFATWWPVPRAGLLRFSGSVKKMPKKQVL